MPTAVYDSSLITKRLQSQAISKSFSSRIQNPVNPTTSYGPLLGIYDNSIINNVTNGQMTEFRRNEGACTTISVGCPCGIPGQSIVPTPIYGWATRLVSDGSSNRALSMNFDNTKSNFYLGGNYGSADTLTLFNSNGSPFIPPQPIPSGTNLFVAKYDLLGNVLWVAALTNANVSNLQLRGSVSDSENNLVVVGRFAGTLTIYNSDGNTSGFTLTATNAQDSFIIKYTPNGTVIWATSISGNGAQSAVSVVTDSFNNIYLAVESSNPIIVNSVGGGSFTINTVGGLDNFLVKYNSNGVGQRGTLLSSPNVDNCYSIAIDSLNNIYMYGEYTGTLTIYNANTPPTQPSTSGTTLAGSGFQDLYLIKYTSDLQLEWATRILSNGTDISRTLQIDSNNNIYLTGSYGGPTTLYNRGGTQVFRIIPAPAPGGSAAFIAVYNTNGIGNWVAYMDSTTAGGSDIGCGISFDSSGNVYTVGTFAGTFNIYNVNGTTNFSLTAVGNQDMFLIKYNSLGFIQWVTKIGGASGNEDTRTQLLIDSNNYLYFSGYYTSNSLTFFNSNGLSSGVTLSLTNTVNMFVAKYNSDGYLFTA
jgi:hypothetical protein